MQPQTAFEHPFPEIRIQPTLARRNVYLQYRIFHFADMQNSEPKMAQFSPRLQQSCRNKQSHKKEAGEGAQGRNYSGCLLKGQNREFIMKYHSKMLEKQTQVLMDFSFSRVVSLGLTIAEFSIQITLIVIQYIASKIGLFPFIALSSLTLLLAALAFLSLNILSMHKISHFLKVSRKSQRLHSSTANEGETTNPTLQNIRENGQNQMYEKSLKMKVVMNELQKQEKQDQTFKQLASIAKEYYAKSATPQRCSLTVTKNMYLIMVSKSIQLLFSLIISTLCLCTVENPVAEGFTYVTVFLIAFYALLVVSSAVLVCFGLKIQRNILTPIDPLQNSQIIQSIKNECKTGQTGILLRNAGTLLSIDKNIPRSTLESKNKRQKRGRKIVQRITINQQDANIKSHSIQYQQNTSKQNKQNKGPKSLNYVDQEPSSKLDKKEESVKGTKKSLLKQSKKYQSKPQTVKSAKCDGNENQIYIERKKVEINSKKIQYFEYADLSSPKAVDKFSEDQYKPYPKKVYQKSNKYSQRKRCFQQKLMNDQQLLQRKKQENQKRAIRSAKLVSNQQETAIRLKPQPSSIVYTQ